MNVFHNGAVEPVALNPASRGPWLSSFRDFVQKNEELPGSMYAIASHLEWQREFPVIVFELPSCVKKFLREYCDPSDEWVRLMLGSLLVGFILGRGRRTLANLGDSVLEHRRDRSNVSRFFSGHADEVSGAYNRAVRRAVTRVHRACRKRGQRKWLLAIDTTFQSKHALRMDNLIVYKEKEHGVPSANHGFVVGLLFGPDGTRIPLPVEDFLTRKFLRSVNEERRKSGEAPLVHRSQLDLADDLIRSARKLLPRSVSLCVVVDNFFEGPKLDRVCNELGIIYVTPLDSARKVAEREADIETAARSVKEFQKSLSDDVFRRVAFSQGTEPWASLRRRVLPKRKPGRRREKVYQVARRVLTVKGLGERTVLFSWKRRRLKYNTHRAQENLKVLVTNSISLTTEEILDAYAIRWEIELFFRELKSDLGLGHYQVLTLEAIRSHVHLVLLAFLFLEMQRLDAIYTDSAGSIGMARARTRQLALVFDTETRRGDATILLKQANNPQRLRELLTRALIPRKVASRGSTRPPDRC
jgi:hypothetical protein